MNTKTLCAAFLAIAILSACETSADDLALRLRSQALRPDAAGHAQWEVVMTTQRISAEQTAIIVCDMWDRHWSRGASERVAAMALRMNEVLKASRAKGVTIVHCPSQTMAFYQDAPARRRMLAAPRANMPAPLPHDDPPQPIDASDGGSDTGETTTSRAWSRQHPAIEINQDKDGISDNAQEIWNFLHERGIKHVAIMGVHTNMCVLNRPFAIKAMVRRGMDTMLVRDLTDAMYNPARAPYVSHEQGTRLVIEYIEKFWCPTITSEDLVGSAKQRSATFGRNQNCKLKIEHCKLLARQELLEEQAFTGG